MTVEITYVALKPLRIGGQRREAGELVPEALSWKRAEAWVNQGRIAPVARGAVDPKELKKAEERAQGYLNPSKPEPAPQPVAVDADSDDVEMFAIGQGWYEIPGAEKKMRRTEAVAYLEGLEDSNEE